MEFTAQNNNYIMYNSICIFLRWNTCSFLRQFLARHKAQVRKYLEKLHDYFFIKNYFELVLRKFLVRREHTSLKT